jgi:hypothetical protein
VYRICYQPIVARVACREILLAADDFATAMAPVNLFPGEMI